MDWQVCEMKSVTISHVQTDTHTDSKVKTEGPKIMCIDIRYLHSVVIVCPFFGIMTLMF